MGTIAWTNTSNIFVSDDSRASAQLIEVTSNYLTATNFLFSIPSTAFIEGIAARVEKSIPASGDGVVRDFSVRLIVSGTIQGADKADTATNWPTSDAYVRYPSVSTLDLWGISGLTPATINASNFGFAISAENIGSFSLGRQVRVDHVEITIYYIEPTARFHRSSKRIMISQRRLK